MAITHLNNIYTPKVNKTQKQEKAAFENIIRSAVVRIAATTLLAFEPGLSLFASRKPDVS